MHSAATTYFNEGLESTPVTPNSQSSCHENIAEYMLPTSADLVYFGMSAGYWREIALGRPAWCIPSLSMSPQMQIVQKLNGGEWMQNSLFERLQDIQRLATLTLSVPTPIQDTYVKYNSNEKRKETPKDFQRNNAENCRKTIQSAPSFFENCHKKTDFVSSNDDKKYPVDEVKKETEKPFLKFGVRAILAKHSTPKPCSEDSTYYRDHVRLSPANEMKPPMVSPTCPIVATRNFIGPKGPFMHHINHQQVLPWLPGTIRGKNRRGMLRRAVFSDVQRKALEKKFQQQRYIGKPDRKKLASKLGLKDSQVKIWFQNRRMKWRNSKERQMLNTMDCSENTDGTPTSCDVITAGDSLTSVIHDHTEQTSPSVNPDNCNQSIVMSEIKNNTIYD